MSKASELVYVSEAVREVERLHCDLFTDDCLKNSSDPRRRSRLSTRLLEVFTEGRITRLQ